MPVLIRIFTGEPLYTQRVRLDGSDYVLKLDWSLREQRFYLSIFDLDNVPIKVGFKVVPNWPILRRHKTARLPPGELFAFDLSDLESPPPPTLEDFGTRVQLYYYTLEELTDAVVEAL